MVKITYYLDVVSSWCHYVEPAWKKLGDTFGDALTQTWEVALIPEQALPQTAEEEDGYYRRSGIITRQQKMLNSAWVDPKLKEYLAPNLVALACRELGAKGDAVRLAIAHAAMIEGKKAGDWAVSVAAATTACDFDADTILAKAQSSEIEAMARASTDTFHGLGINQRPAFLLESEIEDRAMFSGLIHYAPLEATIKAMIDDVTAYRSWAAHNE